MYRALRELEKGPIDDSQESIVSLKGTARACALGPQGQGRTLTSGESRTMALNLKDPFEGSRLDVILSRIEDICFLPGNVRTCRSDIGAICDMI